MNSSFPNRWSFSYLKFTKYVTNIIAEPKYKNVQQEKVINDTYYKHKASSNDLQVERHIKLIYTYLDLRLFNVVNSIFLSQHPVHWIIRKLFKTFSWHPPQYKSSSDQVQSSAYSCYTPLNIVHVYNNYCHMCLLYKLETAQDNLMILSYNHFFNSNTRLIITEW